jgi:transcriptional regulator with XRE-family HTH domain
MFESLGNFIRSHRQERNLSQERLAEMADISRGQLAAMERGENFSLQYLVKLANALELTELPVDGLRLCEVRPELDAVVRGAALVSSVKRLVAQIAATEGDLDDTAKAFDRLLDGALSPVGPTRAITEGAERMRKRPAADHGRIGAALREVASPHAKPSKRADPATTSRRRAR